MILILIILLLVIFFSYLPSYSSKISRTIGSYFIQLTDEESDLRQQIKGLKVEQSAVSMAEEFVKYMKMQRKIDKLVEQVKKMGEGVVMLLLIVIYKRDPLYMLPSSWFMPLSWLIAFPTGVSGGIGVTCWMLVGSSVVYRLKKFVHMLSSAQELKIDT